MHFAQLAWTQAGLDSAAAAGIAPAETVEALYAPEHSRFSHTLGELTFVIGIAASTGRAVFVQLSREPGGIMFWIQYVRLAGPAEVAELLRRTQ